MYAGQAGRAGRLRGHLLPRRSIPTRGACSARCRGSRPRAPELQPIPGTPPSLLQPAAGCRFHLRCSYAMAPCLPEVPSCAGGRLERRHQVACHLDADVRGSARRTKLVADVMSAQRLSEGGCGRPLVTVENLEKHFPITRGIIFQKEIGARAGRRRRLVLGPQGRDARRRGRVRLRQVDDGALRHAAARHDRRQDRVRRAGHHQRSRATTCARCGAR